MPSKPKDSSTEKFLEWVRKDMGVRGVYAPLKEIDDSKKVKSKTNKYQTDKPKISALCKVGLHKWVKIPDNLNPEVGTQYCSRPGCGEVERYDDEDVDWGIDI